MENVLEVKSLRKEYKDFALKDISFRLPRGFIMGLIGPNGAGKTTIIKLIMNLIRRKAGEIKVFGMDNREHEAEIKSRIGFVYEVPCFFEDVLLKDIKASFAPFYVKWDENVFLALMEEFELPMTKKFKHLSQGMKTKFALALALSHDADFIIMDEPTTGLDPVFRRELLEKLSRMIQDEKKSVLFSTHITSDLDRIADYITFIRDGEIVLSCDKDELLENWGIVRAGRELLDDEYRPYFKSIRAGEYGVNALTSNAREARKKFPSDVVIEKPTLEDLMVFMEEGDGHG